MSLVAKLLTSLTPPPVVVPEDYDGLEWRWRMLSFRPAYFQREAWLLTGLLLYVAVWWFASSRNKRIANKWVNAHIHIYEQQFSKTETKYGCLTADGYSDFFNFCTGRRNVVSLHTIFTFRPRHDLFQWVFQMGRRLVDLQYRPKDDLQLDFTLAPGVVPQDFVWAVVSKDELLTIKDSRWDLTLTKTTENPNIPANLSIMSEFADVTDNIIKLLGPLINDERVLPFFRSLSITDQPRDRPNGPIPTDDREKHLILSLEIPPFKYLEQTTALVTGLFPFIDSLSKINLRPETRTKLKKVREELDKELRADAEKNKKEELEQAMQDRKAAKKRAEEERVAKLSAADQRKHLEKEKKKAIRKTQGKVVKK